MAKRKPKCIMPDCEEKPKFGFQWLLRSHKYQSPRTLDLIGVYACPKHVEGAAIDLEDSTFEDVADIAVKLGKLRPVEDLSKFVVIDLIEVASGTKRKV